MTARLPDWDRAAIDIRKLEDYCLNPLHPKGRHKARVFQEAIGIGRHDAMWLRNALLEVARSHTPLQVATDAWGSHWRLDVSIERLGRKAVVRSIWIVRTGEDIPRLVSCWVL